jgi:PAS domain S-box-containing protein
MSFHLPATDTLHRLLEQAPGFIVFTDRDMNILYLNRAAHGFDREKTIGTNYSAFLTPDQLQNASTAYRRATETGAEQHYESCLDTPNGGRRWMSNRVSVMREPDGTVMGFVHVTTDITEQKQSELALEKTRKELLEASHRAGMAEVATGVLHNIGNVLNSLSVASHMAEEHLNKSRVRLLGEAVARLEQDPQELARFLTQDPQGAKFPRLLRRIADELVEEQERLLAQVARVNQQAELMQSTISAQQAAARTNRFVQEVELRSLIERVVSIFRIEIEIESRAIELRVEAEPATVLLDKQAVLQILANLVRNAIEAMDSMGGAQAQPRRLTLRAAVRDGHVIMEVEDTGCGIEAELQTRVFQHGFTTKPSGHGFGLHASAIAAQAMDGTLTVHSDGPGRGARFRLAVPHRLSAEGQQDPP